MPTISVEKMGTIDLGRQGENLAKTIEIDVSSLLEKWPGAIISILVKRKGDADPYFADAEVDGGILYWPITNVETAVAGDGKLEIQAVSGEVIAKSVTATFRVSPSLSGAASTELPDVYPSWVDDVLASAGSGGGSGSGGGTAIGLDTTLSKSGKAADAAAVGAEIDRLDEEKADRSEIPKVPDWAVQSKKPTYTASEVGADPAGTANTAVIAHNTYDEAHNDIRLLISGLTQRLNSLADSDDTTLDQLSEIVAYIKSNKSLIDGITSGKVNVTDIVNNLTTNTTTKPLSAAQGVALKKLIDAIVVPTKVSQLTNDAGYLDANDLPETIEDALAQAKASGEFDGVDGKAATVKIGTVTTLPAGSNATVTNTGTESAAVLNFGIPKGADGTAGGGGGGGTGQDGFSPIASVTQTADGATISITDKNGTTAATVNHGQDGVGIAGVEQTVTSVVPGGQNTMTVRLTDGSVGGSFQVCNGKPGKSAYGYAQEGGFTGSEEEFSSMLGSPCVDEEARTSIAELSEAIGSQTSPDVYGAKGDGVTDDAEAITQALASGQNVIFDCSKTYAIGSTITIPADAHVDFRGATIVPKGNHDVIRVMPGSHIENLIVRCTNVDGWDSSVMVFYAGDKFGAKNPTRISKVKFYNDTSYNDGVENTGNGIYFYTDDFGQTIEGVSVVEAMTSGFRRGVYIKGIDESVDGQGQFSFIGGNNFRGYWSYRDTYGIYIDGRLPNNIIADHSFTDLNIQSDYYGGSKHAIYTNAFSCYFSGSLYDYSILDYHPVTAVYFAIGSAKNVVEVTSGKTTKHDYCINDGAVSNKVIKRCFENDLLIPYASDDVGMIGNQDDAFAFVDKRAECTLESIDSEPREGDISCVFNPSPSKVLRYTTYSADTDKCRAVITINLKKVLTRITNLVLQFRNRVAPQSVKVTLYNANEATVILNTQSNRNRVLVLSPQMEEFDYVYDVAKIVVELGGFNIITETSDGRKYGEWVLERIMAVDSYDTGNAWLRRDGGEVYGNVKFTANNGPVLTSADGKKYLLTVSADGTLGTTEWTEQEEEAPEVAVLTPVMVAGPAWYNAEASGAAQNTITSVAFDATYEPTGNEDASWACDEGVIGDIMAYRNGTSVVIKSTTGSDGVKLNADSSYMFANDGTKANFAALASITGTETWSADNGTYMEFILAKNAVITEPIAIPAGAYSVAKAFQGCTALLTPPKLPEGIVSINNTFASCGVMQYLPEIPSTVANMEYAFHGCKAATKAPSSIPAKVSRLLAAFRNCWLLNGTIEVNAAALTTYNQCFENTSRDGGAVVLTGSCPLLAELAATNTQGKVTVAG